MTDCRPYLRTSTDEAQTWSAPVQIVPDRDADYDVVNNDRVVQLANGRIVVPAAHHRRLVDELGVSSL